MGRRLLVGKIILIILGIVWIIEVFKRRHEDVETLKVSNDNIEKGVIIGFWIVTAFIAWITFRLISGLIN